MKAIDLYNKTKEKLEIMAKLYGVKDLQSYYKLTDSHGNNWLKDYSGVSQVFAQMAFYATNATMISNIVKFKTNLKFLKKVLCDFDPSAFHEKYQNKPISELVEALRYNERTKEGLKWDSSKSKEGNKDSIVTRFSKTLLDCAVYLNSFESKEEVLDDLLKHYPNNDSEQLIQHFRSKIKHGFSVALTCDFLKEFDEAFCDLPKPDVHIKDTLTAYYGKKIKNDYECIKLFQELVEEINAELEPTNRITVYQFDRMIWLVCSGKFFLDGEKSVKQSFLDTIKP